MAAGADGAVDDDQFRSEFEELQDFPCEDGAMDGRAGKSRGAGRIRHCGNGTGCWSEEGRSVLYERIAGVGIPKLGNPKTGEIQKSVNLNHSPPGEFRFPQKE